MRFQLTFALCLASVSSAVVGAPASLNNPSPLMGSAVPTVSPGEEVIAIEAAQRAQEMGFSSAAIAIYEPLLAAGAANTTAIRLGLATALIDEGRMGEAGKVLEKWEGPRTSPWLLRVGLVAASEGRFPAAKAALAPMHEEELSKGEMSWLRYLQGLVIEGDGDHERAKYAYGQAVELSVSEQARARFLLKRDQALLRLGTPPTEAQLASTRKNLDQFQGRKVGYDLTRTYAAMLNAAGRKNDAVAVLQRQLVSIPAEEHGEADEMRLLLGLIAGAESGEGRNALERLLEQGSDRDKQRIGLQMLARASTSQPRLGQFKRKLEQLIATSANHPILEDLLLFHAQVSLASARIDRNSEGYAQAEEDAHTLLQKFPGSPFKAHVYGVLTGSAWEQRRYRTAADNAVKARAELPAGSERAAMGVLAAEAWFRARDFRSAADAYQAAMTELPTGVTAGQMMFQRVLAEIEAGAPEAAAIVLDQLARNPAFDATNRWQAEWNLARALQARGKTPQAFSRVTSLLSSEGPATSGSALPAELRARMVWLQARLSSGSGQPEQTLKLVAALGGSLQGVSPELRTEIESSGELFRAEANFALGRASAALEVLKKLRSDFPRSDAAVYSYFDEADYYSKQDKTVEAQQLLTKLADDFPENARYAPLALFKAALEAERRGQDSNIVEANRLIEDLVRKYPDSELIFTARLKQGDLMRKRNDFPAAQRVYEELVNKYPQRPDITLAQLALAETHNAQSANEPAHAESAAVLFEHVLDRMKAPLDARVEAGYNLGLLHVRREQPAKAEEVWWRDVVNAFLLNEKEASQLSDKGRYWMTRTLLELGALYEDQGKIEPAKEAWLLIIKAKLGAGEALAKGRLSKYGITDVKS
jgi:tetratricopeptide (TPR) repeat protein